MTVERGTLVDRPYVPRFAFRGSDKVKEASVLSRIKLLLFGSVLIILFAVPSYAVPKLKIDPPAKEVALGNTVILKVQLEWPSDEGAYEVTSLEPGLDNLTLVDQKQSQETGPVASQTFLYEFRPIRIGTAAIRPFEISYRRSESEPWNPILVPEHTIKVISKLPLMVALAGSGIVAVLLIAVHVSIKLWERWKIRVAAQHVIPVDPKQRIYKQSEEAITNFRSPDAKEKLTHWSNHFRITVATYYDVSITASPADILNFLKVKGIPAGDYNEISRIFGELTEMQFARHDISEFDLARIQRTLLQYVAGKIIIGNL